jgi:hypothetical protein
MLEEDLPLIEEFAVIDHFTKPNLVVNGTSLISGIRLLHVNFPVLTIDEKLEGISALFGYVNIRLQIAIYMRSKQERTSVRSHEKEEFEGQFYTFTCLRSNRMHSMARNKACMRSL